MVKVGVSAQRIDQGVIGATQPYPARCASLSQPPLSHQLQPSTRQIPLTEPTSRRLPG